MRGHAIEVRLYAEDAEHGFLPATGTLRSFSLDPSVRVDSGFVAGDVVSTFYDPMLAKVIAHAPTRGEAAAHLAAALERAQIHGVVTNRDLLVRILRDDEFLAGTTDTAYLERNDPAVLGAPLLSAEGARAHAVAAALALQAANRRDARVWARLPSGWRNNPSQPQSVVLERRGDEVAVTYAIGRSHVDVAVDGEPVDVIVHSASAEVVDASIGGVRRRFSVAVAGDAVGGIVDVDSVLGSSEHRVLPRFADPASVLAAGSLTAPMPGAVVRVLVESGATVMAGQTLVVLEAMKMEHSVTAPADGVVTQVLVSAGQQVDAGSVLAVVEEESTSAD
jgi:acetyl/propionyl-CoA carboxylase alpha subunit